MFGYDWPRVHALLTAVVAHSHSADAATYQD